MERTTGAKGAQSEILCRWCGKQAATVHRSGMPMCARHATVLMIVNDKRADNDRQ
ncbi:MAG: hypothetical protein BMS9Abin20_0755 [Acidimicrobiia bacterium]|nr:MAG: hypothetical protein BMS9Abin20_0755 [Acidimicrobiia bacterium]